MLFSMLLGVTVLMIEKKKLKSKSYPDFSQGFGQHW